MSVCDFDRVNQKMNFSSPKKQQQQQQQTTKNKQTTTTKNKKPWTIKFLCIVLYCSMSVATLQASSAVEQWTSTPRLHRQQLPLGVIVVSDSLECSPTYWLTSSASQRIRLADVITRLQREQLGWMERAPLLAGSTHSRNWHRLLSPLFLDTHHWRHRLAREGRATQTTFYPPPPQTPPNLSLSVSACLCRLQGMGPSELTTALPLILSATNSLFLG